MVEVAEIIACGPKSLQYLTGQGIRETDKGAKRETNTPDGSELTERPLPPRRGPGRGGGEGEPLRAR